jgi:hypothetical protein
VQQRRCRTGREDESEDAGEKRAGTEIERYNVLGPCPLELVESTVIASDDAGGQDIVAHLGQRARRAERMPGARQNQRHMIGNCATVRWFVKDVGKIDP